MRTGAPAPQPPSFAGLPPSLASVLERDRQDMDSIRRLVAFCLGPDARCIDVGAHRGAVLQEIARVAPYGMHIAYEPLPNLAAELRERFPGVDVRQAALSDRIGVSTFEHVRGDAEGCSGFVVCTAPPGYAEDVEQIDVELERLDDVVGAEAAVALIKVDVEGAEQQVLEGAMETIIRTQPIVVFEHAYSASQAYDTKPEMIFSLLCEHGGLRIFDLNGNGPFSEREFAQRSHTGDPVNFVAHR
jgi:FkbM family methyltransferase